MKEGKEVNELSFATPFMLFAVKTFTSNVLYNHYHNVFVFKSTIVAGCAGFGR